MIRHDREKLHGWDKFIYNMYMILTFPVRRWWIILSVLATVLLVLIIIPTIDGVKKEDIVDWYKAKLIHSDLYKAKNKTISMISKKVNTLKNNITGVLPDTNENIPAEKKNAKKESNLVSWNVAEFKKAKYFPSNKNTTASNKKVQDKNTFALIKEQVKKSAKQIEDIAAPQVETKQDDVINNKDLTAYYEVRTDLNLEYLTEPEIVSGTVTVSGANELYIEDTFVYLYGIYTNPHKYNAAEVKKYLEDITENQPVECSIVAYSTQTQAKTALCFVNGVLINKQMVAEKKADNVALKME